MVGLGSFPGLQLRREMAKIENDAGGGFADGEKLDDDRFFVVREAEEALHGAVLGRHPLLFGAQLLFGAGSAELAFPTSGEPGEISKRHGFLVRRDDEDGIFSLRVRRVGCPVTRQSCTRAPIRSPSTVSEH